MSKNTVIAVAWIAVTAMVLGMASCAYGLSTANQQAEAEMSSRCWEIGGSWETGWNGKWCNRSVSTPQPNVDEGDA